jgi:hypothetical protein
VTVPSLVIHQQRQQKTTTGTTPPPMQFSEAISNAKAAETAVGEKALNSGASPSAPKTQYPVHVASQRSNGSTAASAEDKDEEEDVDMTLRTLHILILLVSASCIHG